MVLRACGEQECRTCTTRKTSRTIDSEIDYGLSRLANGKLRQGKAKSGNKQKPIPHNRSTNPKTKQYIAPHPKPIPKSDNIPLPHAHLAQANSRA